MKIEAGDSKIAELRRTLLRSLQSISESSDWDKNRACVILSGGLDSSIAACLGRDVLGLQAAFTVVASPDATDRPHAATVAAAAGLQHHLIDCSLEEVLGELPTCVRVLQSFDPMSLRNEIAVCRALREAAGRGFTSAVTGDAADELFGGYNFTHRLDDAAWADNRRQMTHIMRFGSVPLGRHFGVYVASPFNQPEVIQAAMQFSKADCVRPRPEAGNPSPEQQQTEQLQEQSGPPAPLLGKMPLRLACPEVPVQWRGKDPIEVGCGTTELGDRPWLPQPAVGHFSKLLSDEEFEAGKAVAAREGVQIRDKEHLHYYREFRRQFPNGEVPGKPRRGSDPCPACGWQLSDPSQTFCVTCGHYDPQLRSRHSRQGGQHGAGGVDAGAATPTSG